MASVARRPATSPSLERLPQLLLDLDSAGLGRRPARPVRHPAGAAARDPRLRRLRPAPRRQRRRLRGAACGHARRPAGGALRPGLHGAADGRADARHRRLRVAERRRRPARRRPRGARHRRLAHRARGPHLRARGVRRQRRQRPRRAARERPLPADWPLAAHPTGTSPPGRRAGAGRPGHAALARRRPDHHGRREQRARRPTTWPRPGWPASPTRSPTRSRRRRPRAAIDLLRVGGGLAADRALLQAVADLSGIVLEVPATWRRPRAGSRRWPRRRSGVLDPDASGHAVAHRVEPALDAAGRERERARWRDALEVHVRPSGVNRGALGPAARAAGARAVRGASGSTCWSSAAASPAPASRWTRPPAGLSVALVEARDIAAGTSSRSSKLIHGGLRYLEMLDFGLVREALRERRLLLTRLAPHLVRPVPFLFPLRAGSGSGRTWAPASLLYDSHGRRPAPAAGPAPVQRAALRSAPALRPDALVGAVTFHDAQEDDALLRRLRGPHRRRARRRHRHPRRGRPAFSATRPAASRARASRRRSTARELTLRARHIVAAAGVGTDRFLELATGRPAPRPAPVQGRPPDGAALLHRRCRRGCSCAPRRASFTPSPGARPLAAGRHGHALARRAETSWWPAGADLDYVLAKVNSVLRQPLAAADVCGVFAGLRPLVASGAGSDTTRLSREHRLFVTDAGADRDRRRQVHHLPGDGPRRGGRGRARARRRRRPLAHRSGAAGRRRPAAGAATAGRPSSGTGSSCCWPATAAVRDEILEIAGSDPALAAPIAGAGATCGPRPCTPSPTRARSTSTTCSRAGCESRSRCPTRAAPPRPTSRR